MRSWDASRLPDCQSVGRIKPKSSWSSMWSIRLGPIVAYHTFLGICIPLVRLILGARMAHLFPGAAQRLASTAGSETGRCRYMCPIYLSDLLGWNNSTDMRKRQASTWRGKNDDPF